MLRDMIHLSVLIIAGLWVGAPVMASSIPIENASFESPLVASAGLGAVPFVESWTEIDLDVGGSTNTGVFANAAAGSPDHVANADGLQLAFLGSQQGNALEQDLAATYKAGCEYRLTVAVGVSMRFPPVDTLELVLYYRNGAESVDIANRTIKAGGLSATQLQDFSLYLSKVEADDAWAGKTIGVAIHAAGQAGGFWSLDNVRLAESLPVSIAIVNASFESPIVAPGGFGAVPLVDGWTEIDIDKEGSTNTGVFLNTPAGSFDHVANADGLQLAFLASQRGNALEQDLAATYKAGGEYRLTVGVGVSARYSPALLEPVGTLELVLYYRQGAESVDIVSETVEATGLATILLKDFSVYLPMVGPDDAWAGKTIGVAIRATGVAGGFWDLDNVRLTESMPISLPIENASFESPVVDPALGSMPFVESWTEIDVDTKGSTNTGVFANTAAGSPDHVANADSLQLAFLGSQRGNALEQDLATTYEVGSAYRLTIGVGVSMRSPPSTKAPVDTLELVLYYRAGAEPVDIASQTIEATGLSATRLQDFSVYVAAVTADEAWAGRTIGVAIRAAGRAGGLWDLDNVRLAESPPAEDFIPPDKG